MSPIHWRWSMQSGVIKKILLDILNVVSFWYLFSSPVSWIKFWLKVSSFNVLHHIMLVLCWVYFSAFCHVKMTQNDVECFLSRQNDPKWRYVWSTYAQGIWQFLHGCHALGVNQVQFYQIFHKIVKKNSNMLKTMTIFGISIENASKWVQTYLCFVEWCPQDDSQWYFSQ